MAVKLKKVKKVNPQQKGELKWHLVQEKTGSMSLPDIAREISSRASLSHGDVQSVLSNLVEVMPLFLKLGQSLHLAGFGSFHLSVSSTGTDTPEELTAHNVRAVKLVFTPSVELKHSLEGISYEIGHELYAEEHLSEEEKSALHEGA
jgi:predicted histone-like DNA-binding protein